MLSISNYRADIDGLRALAVLGVILFHANVAAIPGGFLGVDVFFVISGFLITGILIQRDGPLGATLKDFYARRIRRLVPPALPVLAATLLGGYVLLAPDETTELFRSALAYALFVSNWFFMSVSGYFDISSEFKPLLHTWSLSVEEQFYLLFPVIILLVRRARARGLSQGQAEGLAGGQARGRAWVAALMGAVVAASFLYNLYLAGQGDTTRLFYSSLSRFWEIGVGGLLATSLVPPVQRRATANAVGLAGLGAILASFALAGAGGAVPGVVALPCVLGTALVIHARHGWANRWLAWRPLVGIGLISYALYLWHWPIFVGLRQVYGEPGPLLYALGTALTFALATLSYFTIETPLRFGRRRLSDRFAYATLASSALAFVALAAASERSDGFAHRYPGFADADTRVAQNFSDWKQQVRHDVCLIPRDWAFEEMKSQCLHVDPGRFNVLLVGDSHASQLLPGLETLYADAEVSLLSVSACPMEIPRTGEADACAALIDWLLAADLGGFDAVIVTARGAAARSPDGYVALLEHLARKLPTLAFGPIHHYVPNQTSLYLSSAGRMDADAMNAVFDRALAPSRFEVNRSIKSALQGSDVTYVDALEVLCEGGAGDGAGDGGPPRCRHLDADGLPVLVDNTHMSAQEIVRLFRELEPELAVLAPARRDRGAGDEPWAPRVQSLDSDAVLWSTTSASAVRAGSSATVSHSGQGVDFDLQKDGRLVLMQEFDPPLPAGSTLSFRATALIDTPIEDEVNLILQNKCVHTVEDGRSFDVLLNAPRLVLDKRQPLQQPISCIQIRLWSRNQAVSGRLQDLQVAVWKGENETDEGEAG